VDRQITATNGTTTAITYQYDASGNMTNAVGNGQSWRLTYDEDNRTTSIRHTGINGTTTITNRYDALGRRVAKTVDGLESRFVLDLAGKMERVLCDVDGSGSITAWYVHGPDLAFKVDAANNLTCYHADAMANIIALTGAGGTNLAQYAYSPYGRVFGSTNFSQPSSPNSQPFLFVGSQGVMEELPGLYFMRARYYLAEAGVFLSTDPVKKIGAGWKPNGYAYANNNPNALVDPDGAVAILPLLAKYYAIEQTTLKRFNHALTVIESATEVYAGTSEWSDVGEAALEEAAEVFLEKKGDLSLESQFDLARGKVPFAGKIPGYQSIQLVKHSWNIGVNLAEGFLLRAGRAQQASVEAPRISEARPADHLQGSQLPERSVSAAAYAESVAVNYAKSSKEIQAIYDRAHTAHNNLVDSLSKGQRANESYSQYLDRLVAQMNKDLGLSTTPKAKEPPKKKKKK
jgi:RHS repeat-associated protein